VHLVGYFVFEDFAEIGCCLFTVAVGLVDNLDFIVVDFIVVGYLDFIVVDN